MCCGVPLLSAPWYVFEVVLPFALRTIPSPRSLQEIHVVIDFVTPLLERAEWGQEWIYGGVRCYIGRTSGTADDSNKEVGPVGRA